MVPKVEHFLEQYFKELHWDQLYFPFFVIKTLQILHFLLAILFHFRPMFFDKSLKT